MRLRPACAGRRRPRPPRREPGGPEGCHGFPRVCAPVLLPAGREEARCTATRVPGAPGCALAQPPGAIFPSPGAGEGRRRRREASPRAPGVGGKRSEAAACGEPGGRSRAEEPGGTSGRAPRLPSALSLRERSRTRVSAVTSPHRQRGELIPGPRVREKAVSVSPWGRGRGQAGSFLGGSWHEIGQRPTGIGVDHVVFLYRLASLNCS